MKPDYDHPGYQLTANPDGSLVLLIPAHFPIGAQLRITKTAANSIVIFTDRHVYSTLLTAEQS
jgi:hypothetical protein